MRITPSDYTEISQASEPCLSPDGETIAYVKQTPSGDQEYESTIYTASVSDEESQRFTQEAGIDSTPRWSPDGSQLAFVSTRGNDDTPQLWLLPVDGGEAKQLTDVVGGVTNPTWSPDGRYIAFTQKATAAEREGNLDLDQGNDPEYEREEPDPRVIGRLVYREHGGYIDGRRQHIYLCDTEGDEVQRFTDGELDYANPDWGDDTTLYATVRRTGDPDDNLVHDIVAFDIDTGEEEETVVQTTGWDPSFSATSDGRVAFRYSDDEPPGPSMRLTEVRVADRDTGEVRTVTDSLSRRVYRGCTPVWDDDEDSLYILVPDEGTVDVYQLDPNGELEPSRVDTGETEHIEALSVRNGNLAFTQSTATAPSDVFVTSTDGGAAARVSQLNDDFLDQRDIQTPEEVWVETEDGIDVQGWVLTPPEFDESESYPTVLEIHGGPSIMWTTSGTMWHEFQLLAAMGYVVAWCNPRGSTGYGEEHTLAIGGDWGGPDYRDLMAFTDELVGRSHVDEENLFVTGGSFGGFMTSWIVGHTTRFSGAVTQRGVYDQIAQFGATDTYHSNEKQLGLPWEDPMKYWESSPVAYADQVETPTLIIHSEEDYRVPIHNADTLYRFYRKNGVDTRYIRYPREGHELSRAGEPTHVVDRLERILRWFNGYSDYHEEPPVVETDETSEDWEPSTKSS